ncbi:MAG: acetyl esterase [Paracoccaceae bacterium]|jgi:acetyl esterase
MIKLDPALFAPDAVSAETRAFNETLEATLSALPATHTIPPEVTRRARDEGKGIFPQHGPLAGSEWRDIDFDGKVRVTPSPRVKATGIYLHIHGGGWTIGSPAHHDRLNQELAAATGAAVVSVRYRLAPEHPWPAGPDDVMTAARWLIGNAMAEFGTDRIVIGGESAGAHLAAVALLRLRAEGLGGKIAGAVFNYGCFDMRMTASMRNWGPRQLVLSTPTVAWFADNFIPDVAVREDPIASPLLAELSGMPPALFQIGTMDPLIDDSLQMAARWTGAGLDARLAVYPGGVHAFDAFDLAISHQARAASHAFVAEMCG